MSRVESVLKLSRESFVDEVQGFLARRQVPEGSCLDKPQRAT